MILMLFHISSFQEGDEEDEEGMDEDEEEEEEEKYNINGVEVKEEPVSRTFENDPILVITT